MSIFSIFVILYDIAGHSVWRASRKKNQKAKSSTEETARGGV